MKRAGTKRPKSGVVKIGRASGRVKCYIRIRPLNVDELQREDESAVEVSEDKKEVLVNDTRVGLDKNYQFDHVFPPETTNPQISNFISKPLVNAALNGFNGTVMAYGQTGSGKTYTLMSPDGVAATIIEKSFRKMAANENLQYKVSMSYLQIYQEKIYDLLNNAASSKIDLTIREHPQKGIYVENLSEYVVRGPEEVNSLMQLGKKRLIFAETKMNRTSSRSHSVCILSIERSSKQSGKTGSSSVSGKKHFDKKLHDTLRSEGVETPGKMDLSKSASTDGFSSESEEEDDALSKMMAFNEDVVLKGHLYICDLAGSERIKKTKAEGERLSEAQHINFSLLELGNVIQALAESADTGRTGHIPFRNSTLTRLLQESLGGNCKTSLVVCCSPSDLHVHETKCSLNFGSRAMKVRNTAYVNVEMDYKKLSDDLAKLLDARDKEIEELKQSQQRELDLSKKEAEMAAELKFGDGLTEARKAYIALKHLLDSQASAHAESMSKLQAELSREKDAKLALEEELQNKRHSSNDKHSSTKSLLLTEVLSMQLYYALECTACRSAEMMERASQELAKEDAIDTQEEILENVDNLIGVLGTYLNLTEREFSEAKNEEYYSDEDIDVQENEWDGRVEGLETLVVKIRKRLKVLKDSVDGRTLRFLNNVIDRKDRASMENMNDVYQVLQKLLAAQSNSADSEFLENSQDAERCLTYVLLDKALLCCLVVLERSTTDRKFQDLGKMYETTTQELEIVRHQNKSLKNDNERLIAQLNRRRNDMTAPNISKENPKPIEALMLHNSKLQLEIETLRRKLGSRRSDSMGAGKDIEMKYLREKVAKLTKENEKLEFMLKVLGERFSENDTSNKLTREAQTQVAMIEEENPSALKENNNITNQQNGLRTGKLISTYDSETKLTSSSARSPESKEPEVEKVITFSSGSPSDPKTEGRKAVNKIEREEFREHLLSSKMESDKTLKHLIEIKETLEFLDKEKENSKKLNRLVDSAIDSAEHVNMNADLLLSSSMEDIEALERDINAMKANNEALGRQCLSLVNDRTTLESLLTDLRGNIAGLQEKVENSPSSPHVLKGGDKHAPTRHVDEEITTEVYRTKTTKETPPSFHVQSWETESVKKTNISAETREFETKNVQTDVSFISDSSNESGESDGHEDDVEEEIKTHLAVKKLTRKYSLVKQLVKHLEGEIRNFKIRTTALETELKERQHLKDQNVLLEEEVKELQGLKIYLESQLAEEGENAEKPERVEPEESNLKKWKNYETDSFTDLSSSSHLSSSTLNLTSSPMYGPKYHSLSQSMVDLSEPQMYTSFSSLRSSRGGFGSLKMLRLEMEGKPSRIRDKLKNASLLLQHTGSLESQLKASRQKCFRLEGEVCKLVKEKKEISEELDKVRARLRAEERTHDAEFIDKEKQADDASPFGSKPKRRSFRFSRGKEEKDRLKNELSLAKEQLTKLKSQLEMANTSVRDSSSERRAGYSELSEDEIRRERELSLTRERCLILAEELGASNKEKIKLGDDLEEALDNIDVLANEVKRLEKAEEEKLRLEKRVEELEKHYSTRQNEDYINGEKLVELRSDVASLVHEKANLEDSIAELKWEKERLNEMENIVKRLVQVEKEKNHTEEEQKGNEISQERVELMRLRKDNEDLREQLSNLNEVLMELEVSSDKGNKNTSLTQVLSAVKDSRRRKSDKQGHGKGDIGTRSVAGGNRERGWQEPTKSRGARSTSSDREDTHGHREQKNSSEKKSRTKVLANLLKH